MEVKQYLCTQNEVFNLQMRYTQKLTELISPSMFLVNRIFIDLTLSSNLPDLTGTGTVSVRNAGCVEKSFCGTNQTGSILNIEYAASFKCCTTDLCNDASSLQLSLMVALCFGAVTSVWLML